MKVAIVMGSDSDFPVVEKAVNVLKKFGIELEVRVLSAHRTPHQALAFSENAEKNGFDVIIAAAGKSAHLPGVLAAVTILPVIGLPIKSSTLDGLDSLFSIENAALLAVHIMALKYDVLKEKLKEYRKQMAAEVEAKDKALKY